MSNTISGSPVQPLIYEPRPVSAPSGAPGGEGFVKVLRSAIAQVEELQSSSDQQVSALLQGEKGDVHNVMIAIEKADVAFQLMMQVRNKIVNAYQQVSQMQF
jgi:flagellar hook-basal body complex protein FliE